MGILSTDIKEINCS